MHRNDPTSLLAGAIILAVIFVGYLVIELLDRATESPAMKRRVNEGSDKFFAERGSVVGEAMKETSETLDDVGLSRRRFWPGDGDP